MTIVLGCIADDYTGASDLANTLSKAGLRTIQTIGVPDRTMTLPPSDAVVVALKSRSIAASDAVAQSLDAHRWLKAEGARHILFKICSTFDSTDAGNIGPVMDALREREGGGVVLVTPAFPEVRRTVYKGHLFVGDQLLEQSPLKDHPLNPMHDSNLVRVLGRQSRNRVGLVELATVAKGQTAIEARIAELAGAGIGAAIIDAVFDADLEAIGQVALQQTLSVGASGIGLGLARALAGSTSFSSRDAAPSPSSGKIGGPAAALAGSCSRATLEQLAAADRSMPVLRLDSEALVMDGPAEVAHALAWAGTRLEGGPLIIAASEAPDAVAALQSRHGRDQVGHAIEQAMATLAEELVRLGVRRLIVAGGETSGAVVDRLGVTAFQLGAEIAPGVPLLRTIGYDSPMLMALKSGNFGGETFFSDAFAAMEAG